MRQARAVLNAEAVRARKQAEAIDAKVRRTSGAHCALQRLSASERCA